MPIGKPVIRTAMVLGMVLAALLFGSACGGGQPAASPVPGASSPTVVPQASPAQTTPSTSPTPLGSPTPSGTFVGTGTPVPTGTPSSQQGVDAALAAALTVFDAVTEADCLASNPHKKDCVSFHPRSQPSSVLRGIALFGVGHPEYPTGIAAVLGRDPNGEWKFWFAGQQFYQLLILPADVLVCAEGQRLNVRSEPTLNAPVTAQLDHMSTAGAEEFVLTEPGTYPRKPGYGWYRLSAPHEGWAYSRYLTGEGSCFLRNAVEAS